MEDFGRKIKKGLKNRNFWYTAVFLIFFFFIVFLGKNLAQAADVPTIVTYQGKLLINGSVATTTQSMKFVLYDSLSGGTALYSASSTTSTPQAVSTTVSNGFFTVNLGDTGTNSLDPTIFKNNSAVYLEVIIGGETLTPRKRLTAAPYAFNAKYLDGISATTTPQNSAYIPVADSSGNFNLNSVTSSALIVTGETNLATTTLTILNLSNANGTDLNFISGSILYITSSGTANLTDLSAIGNSTLATTTISSSTISYLNVTNNTAIGGLLSVTGNSSFGTITSGTWNGTAISNAYGGIGQNSSGWTGFVKVTAGTWATSTISTSDLSNASSLAFLASDQTFTGANIFSSTTTFATTTITSSTIGYLNVTNNTAIGGLLSVTGNSSFGTITSGTWNGTAISNAYGGTGQNSSGWTGFVKVTAGTWATSTVSLTADVSGILPLVNGGTGTSTMASGGVVFSDGSKLAQDATKFYWDNTNKFLGVGTSSPQQKLHLYDGTLLVDSPITPTTTGYVVSSTLTGATSLDVSGKYAYVTSYLDSRLTVVDISDPVAPVVLSSIKDATRLNGPWTVKVAGKYAYVTSDTGDSLTIINIANPFSMSVVGYVSSSVYLNHAYGLSISGQTAYVTGKTGNQLTAIDISNPNNPTIISSINDSVHLNEPKDVYVQGDFAYVANGVGSGVAVINISNQHSLSYVGFTSSSVMDAATKIYVSGKYAYVTASTSKALVIVDISNPSAPTTTGSISGSFILSSASDVKVAGNYAYVTAYGANSIAIIDISSKTSPSITGSTYSPTYLNSPTGIFLSGKYAYVISYGGESIAVVDIKGANISSASIGDVFTNTLSVWENSDFGNNLSIRNGLNVGAGGIMSSGAISINIDSSVSTSTLFSVATSSKLFTIFGDGSVGIGATTTAAKLQVLNTSEQLRLNYNNSAYASFTVGNEGNLLISPSNNATTSISGGLIVNSNSLVVSQADGFVGLGTTNPQQKLHLYNGTLLVDNPVNPTSVGSVTFSSSPGGRSVYVSGNYAYAVTNNGLAAIDVKDKSNPTEISSLSISGIGTIASRGLAVAGNYAYVVAGTGNTMSIIDISNPKSMSVVGTLASSTYTYGAAGLYVSGKYAYILANGSKTFTVVDISDPSNPFVMGSVTDNTKFNGFYGIYVSGKYAYVTGQQNNYLSVIDVSNPASPSIVGNVFDNSYLNGARAVYVSGKYAYVVSDFSDSLAVVNISDPTAPAVVGHVVDATNLDGGWSIYVSGKYAYIAANSANKLSVVDISSSTNPLFIGAYTSTSNINSPYSVYVSGKYAYVVSNVSQNLDIIDLKGADISTADLGNISSNDLTVSESVDIGNNLNIRNSLNVGSGGLLLNGDFSMSGSVTNTLSFSTTTVFYTSVPSSSNNGFIFNAANTPSSSSKYILSLRAGGTPVFSVSSNGNVNALGTLNAISATVGTPGTPGDLAEKVDISLDDSVEPGDVVVVDPNSIDTYRRSSGEYSETVAGVISTNPTIVVGNGKTENTAVMAMVGRVPIKVSSENGAIKKGDLLVTATLAGYAMHYDSKKDISLKTISVVGLALEDMAVSTTGKIMGLVKTGWINNSASALSVMKTDLQKLATAQGVTLSSSQDLNVQNVGGSLTYNGGNLDLQGNQLLNVSSIVGKNSRWLIDEQGRFVTRLSTSQGDKEMYAMQSPNSEFVFSSSSQMESGEVKIEFDQYVQEVIDQQQPIKINITLTSGEAKGIYVSEKSAQGFTVKELEDGHSNASFDWMVVAKRKIDDQQPTATEIINNLINNQSGSVAPTLNSDVVVSSSQMIDVVSTTVPTVESTESTTNISADNATPVDVPVVVPAETAPVQPALTPDPTPVATPVTGSVSTPALSPAPTASSVDTSAAPSAE